jgi:ribosomal protein S18 acetylase RimI-like enzyme
MATRGERHRVRLGEERDIVRVEALVNWAYRGQLPAPGTCDLEVSGPDDDQQQQPDGDKQQSKGQWTTEAHLLSGPRVTSDELRRLLALDARAKAALIIAEELCECGEEEERWLVVGCVLVEKEDDGGHLGMFSIHPHRQGRGVGRLLLEAGEAHITDVFGRDAVLLHVLGQRTDLLAFYQRRGYTLLPRESHPVLEFPPHLGQSLVAPDQEPLHFRILAKTSQATLTAA